MRQRNLLALSLLCVTLSACGTKYSSPPTVSDKPQQVERPTIEQTTTVEPARPTIEPTTSVPPQQAVQSLPAAIALRDQATTAANANDNARAIGLLERALRISPADPQTFYDLASNYLSIDQPQQALQLARRGLSLNPTNSQRDAIEELITKSQAML